MVIKFFDLVLKKYRKSFLKMCGNPDFNFSTFPAFVFFLVSLITLLVFQEKSRFIGNGSVSRFPEMFEAKNVFFWSRKSSKTVSSSIIQTHCKVMESEPKFPALGPAKGIHIRLLQIWLQISKKIWLRLQNDLVEKTLKTNAIFVQLSNFRLWHQFWFHYLKNLAPPSKIAWAPVPQPFPRVHCLLRSKGDEQRNSQMYSFGAACHLYLTTQKSLICTASAKT